MITNLLWLMVGVLVGVGVCWRRPWRSYPPKVVLHDEALPAPRACPECTADMTPRMYPGGGRFHACGLCGYMSGFDE